MATWAATITNDGAELQNKQINGADLIFSKVLAGSNSIPVADLKTQTAMTDTKQELSIHKAVVDETSFAITVMLSNDSVKTEYNLSQVGFFAMDPDVGEILYAIAQIDTPKEIPISEDAPGYGIELVFTFANNNGSNVVITPDFAAYVTLGDVEAMVNNLVEPGDIIITE